MRFAVFFAFALLVPGAWAHEDDPWPPGNHSPHVATFTWEPREPQRGEPMHAELVLHPNATVHDVALVICRVQNYACRTPIAMPGEGAGKHVADVPWDQRFYSGVTEVGFSIVIRFTNGSTEESPIAPWPGPAALPEGADPYYFFHLPPQPPNIPGLGAWAACLALLLWAWRRP